MQKINLQLFGKVIDLSDELSTENPVIKIGDKEFAIDTRFKVVLELDKLFKDKGSDMEFMQKFFVVTLGKKAADELMSMNLNVKSYKKIIKIIGDEIKGSDDDGESGAAV